MADAPQTKPAPSKPAARTADDKAIGPDGNETDIVTDLEPKVGDDGKVYVSDAISQAAVDAGYAADEMARAHPLEGTPLVVPLGATVDYKALEKDAKQAAEDHQKNAEALMKLEAPLSVKVQKLADEGEAE